MELKRWKNFNKSQQLLMIGSEIMRAKVWQKKDEKKFHSALNRALALLELTLQDNKWEDHMAMISGLREEVRKFQTRERTDDISILYQAL